MNLGSANSIIYHNSKYKKKKHVSLGTSYLLFPRGCARDNHVASLLVPCTSKSFHHLHKRTIDTLSPRKVFPCGRQEVNLGQSLTLQKLAGNPTKAQIYFSLQRMMSVSSES